MSFRGKFLIVLLAGVVVAGFIFVGRRNTNVEGEITSPTEPKTDDSSESKATDAGPVGENQESQKSEGSVPTASPHNTAPSEPSSQKRDSASKVNTPSTGAKEPSGVPAPSKQSPTPTEAATKGKESNRPTAEVQRDFNATPGEGTCSEQWSRYIKNLKESADLTYLTNMAVQKPIAPEINTIHQEVVKKSSNSGVTRSVEFSSDHPTGVLVLSTLEMPTSVTVSQDSFLRFCSEARGRWGGLALFKMNSAKIIGISDETIQVGAGEFAAHKIKLDASLSAGKKSVRAAVIVWVSRKKPGLVLKQTVKFRESGFPEHGSITFTSQLAGTRKI